MERGEIRLAVAQFTRQDALVVLVSHDNWITDDWGVSEGAKDPVNCPRRRSACILTRGGGRGGDFFLFVCATGDDASDGAAGACLWTERG